MLIWCLKLVSFRGCICHAAVLRSILSCWVWFKILRVNHCPFNGEVLAPPKSRWGKQNIFTTHNLVPSTLLSSCKFLQKSILSPSFSNEKTFMPYVFHLRVPLQTGFVMLSPLFHCEHFPASAVTYDKV